MAMGLRGFCSRLIPGPLMELPTNMVTMGTHITMLGVRRQLRAVESFLFARYKQRESGELDRDLH